ncbi:MAG: tetratricopeptide repeat protein [Prevotellaceae bacterium]|jgi:tetratricopeptide (TPR) repeat protein|nr:tetratricopeptide repeat protein [Prevotellaceae bacterium]
MWWDDEDTTFFESAEVAALVRRYENMVKHNRADYFDEEEYETIVEHYLMINKLSEALRVADCGSRQHPFSDDMKLCYASVLLEKKEAAQALQLLQEMEAKGVNDSELSFLIGTAYMQMGDITTATDYFDKCTQQTDEEDLLSLLLNVASDLMEKQEYTAALKYIKTALELAPEDMEVINEMAFCNERLNNLDESLYYYEKYIKEEPFNDNVWYNIGTVYARKNDYRQAMQAFHFAVTLNNKHASAYYNLANTYVQQENYAEAVNTFQTFLELEPDNSAAYVSLAGCYEKLDRFKEAFAAYRDAVIFDDNFAEAHYGLAVAYTNAGKWEQALQHMYKAATLKPGCLEYWLQLGNILLQSRGNKKTL